MQENRETSVAAADSAGRTAKAQSHKAGIHAREESDRGAVPMNQPNKGAQASAEVGEGRPRPKENTGQSHTPPVPNGRRVSQRLIGVRRAAQERKQERFTTLLHHLNVDLLRASYYALQRKAAPGVDGMRWKEYEDGLEGRLTDLHSQPGERTGHSPRGESIYRRPTGSNARWASRVWRTRLFNRPW
jgi:RNA-directed DNA polymerase